MTRSEITLPTIKAALPPSSPRFTEHTRNEVALAILAEGVNPIRWAIEENCDKIFLFVPRICEMNFDFYISVYDGKEISGALA